MPLVNIRLARREQPTGQAEKDALIAGVTRLLVKVLHKRAESVVVIIDEVDAGNWGEGGETVLKRRRRAVKSQPKD